MSILQFKNETKINEQKTCGAYIRASNDWDLIIRI